MTEPTKLDIEGSREISGKKGDQFQLTAKIYPENVTLPQIFWRSTNPEIATVDHNGLVTLKADFDEVMATATGDSETASGNTCKIIAESLYANGPVAEVSVTCDDSGINDVLSDSDSVGKIDYSAPVEVYNLQGVRVSDNTDRLDTGIYIVRQGKNVEKIAIN